MVGVSRTARAQPQRGGMGGARTGVDPFGNAGQQARDVLGQRLAVGLQGAHAVLDGRDNGVAPRRGPCMARTAPAVQRRLLVSNGTWVDSRRSWVMSLARVRRSLSDLPASPPARCLASRAGVAHGLVQQQRQRRRQAAAAPRCGPAWRRRCPARFPRRGPARCRTPAWVRRRTETDHGGGVAGQHEQIERGVRSSTDIYRQAPTHRAMAAVITTGELDRRGTM